MLNNTYFKDVFSRRWALLAWSLGISLLTIFTISLFHTLRASFQQAAGGLPPALQGLVGDTASFLTINGFVNQQIYIKTMVMFGLVYVLILFTGLLAGEEGDGTLQVLLTQPVSRTKLVLQKFLAGATVWLGLCVAIFLASSLGALLLGEKLNHTGLAAVTFALWLLGLLIGSFTYMVGAITGKRGLSGAIGGLVFFSLYILDALSAGVKSLASWAKITPYHYYSRVDYNIINKGLHPRYVAGFISATLLFVLIATIYFNRRDVYQR